MKILMITHSYYPDDPRVKREANALRKAGYQIDVVCLKDVGERRHEVIDGVRTYRLPIKRHRGKGFVTYLSEYLVFFFYATFKITGLFLWNRYQIIQVHTIPDFLVFCSLVPRLLGTSVILDMHELMPEFFSFRYGLPSDHLIIRVIRFVERISIAFAHYIIAVSDPQKEILISRKIRPEKISVVMNVADNSIFKASAEIVLQPPKDSFIFVYHGLLSDTYDLMEMIKITRELRDKIKGLKFLIIGRGPKAVVYKDLVQDLGLQETVTLMGYRPQEEIVRILSSVDLGVIPLKKAEYTDIAFPTKLAEYIHLGIPAVITQTKSIRRYFDHNCVIFFEPGKENKLAETILGLYRHPERRCQLAQNALKRYQDIAWPKMKKRYYELIGKILVK